MKNRTKKTQNIISSDERKLLPLVVGLVIFLVILVFIIQTIQRGTGSIQSRAGYQSSLTTGDDALSLQEDLKMLGDDPVSAEELNFIKLE